MIISSSMGNVNEVRVESPRIGIRCVFCLMALSTHWRPLRRQKAASVSLRLGHGAALTCHRHVIHYRAAASLPNRSAPHTTQNRSPSCSEGGPVQLSRAHCAHHFTTSKVRVTLNRSPSTVSSIVPFCSCARLCAMFSPRPLPSVLRELSPRTKRSISSSLEMFS